MQLNANFLRQNGQAQVAQAPAQLPAATTVAISASDFDRLVAYVEALEDRVAAVEGREEKRTLAMKKMLEMITGRRVPTGPTTQSGARVPDEVIPADKPRTSGGRTKGIPMDEIDAAIKSSGGDDDDPFSG